MPVRCRIEWRARAHLPFPNSSWTASRPACEFEQGIIENISTAFYRIVGNERWSRNASCYKILNPLQRHQTAAPTTFNAGDQKGTHEQHRHPAGRHPGFQVFKENLHKYRPLPAAIVKLVLLQQSGQFRNSAISAAYRDTVRADFEPIASSWISFHIIRRHWAVVRLSNVFLPVKLGGPCSAYFVAPS